VSERQVDQETVAIVQPGEDECRNKGTEDGLRYAATNASQLTQGGKAARRCLLHMGLHRQILINEDTLSSYKTVHECFPASCIIYCFFIFFVLA